MTIPAKFKTRADAQKAGYFSRRHPTNAEHLANRERLKSKKIKK